MEAIIGRTSRRQLETAVADWWRATRRLAREIARGARHALVRYSRAALLLRAPDRPARRL